MAETLGSLCDKLTIVKLKQWHSEDEEKLKSLTSQADQLCQEIDKFIVAATESNIPIKRLTFASNKIYKKDGNAIGEVSGSIGQIFAHLAHVNCALWHQQEKVYEFEKVLVEDKDNVVKQLALLNLERNQCIDLIDKQFCNTVQTLHTSNQSQ